MGACLVQHTLNPIVGKRHLFSLWLVYMISPLVSMETYACNYDAIIGQFVSQRLCSLSQRPVLSPTDCCSYFPLPAQTSNSNPLFIYFLLYTRKYVKFLVLLVGDFLVYIKKKMVGCQKPRPQLRKKSVNCFVQFKVAFSHAHHTIFKGEGSCGFFQCHVIRPTSKWQCYWRTQDDYRLVGTFHIF